MNTIALTVAKATQTEKKDGFILTLKNITKVSTPFGNKEQSITYYMKVAELTKECKVGYEADLDLDYFEVVERDFIPEDGDNAGQTIICKWLQLKPSKLAA